MEGQIGDLIRMAGIVAGGYIVGEQLSGRNCRSARIGAAAGFSERDGKIPIGLDRMDCRQTNTKYYRPNDYELAFLINEFSHIWFVYYHYYIIKIFCQGPHGTRLATTAIRFWSVPIGQQLVNTKSPARPESMICWTEPFSTAWT